MVLSFKLKKYLGTRKNNSGVYIQGAVDGTGQTIEYYGVIQEIIEVRDKADWWIVIKSKPVERIEIDNVLDVAYQNDVAIVQQQVDVELETTLQHPQHILEEVSDDEILNVKEEISENEENESFDDEEWDDNENETTEKEEWENDGIETSEEEYQTKQAKKKKFRRPIDPKDIAGSISSAPERINHDTHLFIVPFGTADPRQYYPNCRRPIGASSTSQAFPSRRYDDLPLQAIRRVRPLLAGTPSPTGTSPQLSVMRLGDSSREQSDAMAGTPPLTQRFVHPDVSPPSTAAPSATPHDTMSALAPGQKDKLGRVMIESDGSSWHLAKDVARALKECVRRLYTQAYYSWSEISNSIRQAMFNNFKTMCTWESRYNLVIGTTFERKASARLSSWLKSIWDSGERPGWMLPHVFDELGQYWNTDKFKAISDQAKMARGNLKGGSLHTGGAKTVGTIAREMEKKLGRTPIEPEVFKKTHVTKKENESDPDVWVEERVERTFVKNLDSSVQLTPELSTQIWKEKVVGGTHKGRCYGLGSRNDVRRLQSGLEAALAESERKRVTEQQSMSETVQQIKEQVMNLARRPTTSTPDDTDDESDEDDCVDLTP
ncbi:hypothetical protein MTR67_024161 [Solanum verrucosum]|uniref:Uncharacterized protein n=1 Tax=Solanum verrucosum TaxID=315347 RepID=A0AAF0R2F3_SOLVR|nr:hypothetical protein MTR67_024161 [Solanum verrucosum]